MPKLPLLKPREVAAVLARLGFIDVRQRGSHRQFRHADGRGTTVPFHQGRDVSPTLLRQIVKDIGLTTEEFLAAPPREGLGPGSTPPAAETGSPGKPPKPSRG